MAMPTLNFSRFPYTMFIPVASEFHNISWVEAQWRRNSNHIELSMGRREIGGSGLGGWALYRIVLFSQIRAVCHYPGV